MKFVMKASKESTEKLHGIVAWVTGDNLDGTLN